MQFGSTINPALGRVDYSAYTQGAAQGAAQIGQGIQQLGQVIGAAIKEYNVKKEEKQLTDATKETLKRLASKNPSLASQFGVTDLNDDKMWDAGIKAVGPKAAWQFAQGWQQQTDAQEKSARIGALTSLMDQGGGEIPSNIDVSPYKADELMAAKNAYAMLAGKRAETAKTKKETELLGTDKKPSVTFSSIKALEEAYPPDKYDYKANVSTSGQVSVSDVSPRAGSQAKRVGFSYDDALKQSKIMATNSGEGFVAAPKFDSISGNYEPGVVQSTQKPGAGEEEIAKLAASSKKDSLDKSLLIPQMVSDTNEAINIINNKNPNIGADKWIKDQASKILVIAGSEGSAKNLSETQRLEAILGKQQLDYIKSSGLSSRNFDSNMEREMLAKAVGSDPKAQKEALLWFQEYKIKLLKAAAEKFNKDIGTPQWESFKKQFIVDPVDMSIFKQSPIVQASGKMTKEQWDNMQSGQ